MTIPAADVIAADSLGFMHTTPMMIPVRKGAWVQRRVSKSQGRLRSQTTVPAVSRMHQCIVLA